MTASGRNCSSRNRRNAARAAASRASSCSSADEPLVRPSRVEHLVELRLRHHMAPGMAVMEHLHDLVHRRPIDKRVMRRRRDAQHVGVLVRSGQLRYASTWSEAQHQRLVPRYGSRRDRNVHRREPRDAFFRGRRHRAQRRGGLGRRQVERLEHERRNATCPGTAVVGGMGQDQFVARPGHRDVEQPPFLGERRVPPSAGPRARVAAGSAQCLRRGRCPGTARPPARAGRRPGIRGPSPCGPSGPPRRLHRGRGRPWRDRHLPRSGSRDAARRTPLGRPRAPPTARGSGRRSGRCCRGPRRRRWSPWRRAVPAARCRAGMRTGPRLRALVGHRGEPRDIADEAVDPAAGRGREPEDARLPLELLEHVPDRAIAAAAPC